MKKFEIIGIFKKHGIEHKYTKIIEAENEEQAKEKNYSLFGGNQKIPRRNITIETLKEAKK